jgi:hypothetical protein
MKTRSLAQTLALLCATTVLSSALSAADTVPTHGIPPVSPLRDFIYTDFNVNSVLKTGWQQSNRNTSASLRSTGITRDGSQRSYAIVFNKADAYAGLWCKNNAFDTRGYAWVSFWIHGGDGGQQIEVQAVRADGQTNTGCLLALTAGEWQQVTIPLAKLGVEGVTNLAHLRFVNQGGGAAKAFYVDDLRFVEDVMVEVGLPDNTPVGDFIYTDFNDHDVLQTDWDQMHRNTVSDLRSTGITRKGSPHSCATKFLAEDACLGFYHKDYGFDTRGYASVSFWINGGDGGQDIEVLAARFIPGGDQGKGYRLPTLIPRTWQQVTIPLADLGVEWVNDLFELRLVNKATSATNVFYIDDLKFLKDNSEPLVSVINVPDNTSPPTVDDFIYTDFNDNDVLQTDWGPTYGNATIDLHRNRFTRNGSKQCAAINLWAPDSSALSPSSAGFMTPNWNFDTRGYASVRFWINGGGGGQNLEFQAMRANGQVTGYQLPTLIPRVWQQVTIPLAELGVEWVTDLGDLSFVNKGTSATNTFYVDDLHFVKDTMVELGIIPVITPPSPLRDFIYTDFNEKDVLQTGWELTSPNTGRGTLRYVGSSGDTGGNKGSQSSFLIILPEPDSYVGFKNNSFDTRGYESVSFYIKGLFPNEPMEIQAVWANGQTKSYSLATSGRPQLIWNQITIPLTELSVEGTSDLTELRIVNNDQSVTPWPKIMSFRIDDLKFVKRALPDFIYTDFTANDVLQTGWAQTDHNTVSDLRSTGITRNGSQRSYAIDFKATDAYAGLQCENNAFDTRGYAAMSFWIHGGYGGQEIEVQAVRAADDQATGYRLATLKPGEWQLVTIPLSALGVGSVTDLAQLRFVNKGSSATNVFYVDDLKFVKDVLVEIGLPFGNS